MVSFYRYVAINSYDIVFTLTTAFAGTSLETGGNARLWGLASTWPYLGTVGCGWRIVSSIAGPLFISELPSKIDIFVLIHVSRGWSAWHGILGFHSTVGGLKPARNTYWIGRNFDWCQDRLVFPYMCYRLYPVLSWPAHGINGSAATSFAARLHKHHLRA